MGPLLILEYKGKCGVKKYFSFYLISLFITVVWKFACWNFLRTVKAYCDINGFFIVFSNTLKEVVYRKCLPDFQSIPFIGKQHHSKSQKRKSKLISTRGQR